MSTDPAGVAPVAATVTVTLKDLPCSIFFGSGVALVVDASMAGGGGGVVGPSQLLILRLSTYQPSIPPQPSRPMSSLIRTWSPATTPMLARLTIVVPHVPVGSPPS